MVLAVYLTRVTIFLCLSVRMAHTDNCDLSNKNIMKLNASVINSVSSCSDLNLHRNLLTRITNDSFISFQKLQHLDLSNNNIDIIETGAFVYLRSLISLNLSRNQIGSLQDDLLTNNYYLQVLDISHNMIQYIDNTVFTEKLQNLHYVNLSHNSLTSMEPWPYIPPNIYTFNVTYNNISSFTNQLNWRYDLRLPYKTNVDIRCNNLRTFHDCYMKQYSARHNPDFVVEFVTYNLDIRDNPWVCDCNFYNIAHRLQTSVYKYADVEYKWVKCFEPPELKGEYIIETVFLDHFVCNVTDGCPPGCLCQDRPERNWMEITCDQWNHTKLPEVLPDNKYDRLSLSMNNNYINRITKREYLSDIVILSLKNNRIRHIDASAILALDSNKLQSLDLQNNQINKLPETIHFVQYDIINVDQNPFVCDCSMIWMAKWLKLAKENNKHKNIECTLENKKRYKIYEINESVLNCTYDVEIGLAVVLGLLLILVIIGIVWAKRCPYETKVLIYKFFRCHPSDKYIVDDNIQDGIDLYISFDDSDIHIRQWVIRKLAKRLEEEKPTYKVFVPVRDLNFAEQTADGIIENMEKSKRILIILSEKYDDNEWCTFECQRAELLDFTKGRIIFLKYHPQAEKMLEKDPWKSRVKGRKIIVPGVKKSDRRWFWDKLRYELPVK